MLALRSAPWPKGLHGGEYARIYDQAKISQLTERVFASIRLDRVRRRPRECVADFPIGQDDVILDPNEHRIDGLIHFDGDVIAQAPWDVADYVMHTRDECAQQLVITQKRQLRPLRLPNSYFIEHVGKRVASAKAKGATHALLVHMVDGEIVNYVALEVEDVAEAYRRQIAHWPKRARNTKTPTLYFEDSRHVAGTDMATAVTELELPLSTICGIKLSPKGTIDVKKVTAETEVRLRQQAFRLRVGERAAGVAWSPART